MTVIETALTDVKILEPKVFTDQRGFFQETWNLSVFAQLGIEASFVQDNHCRSVQASLRGLHYQIRNPQGKLVRVTHGAVIDVVVDLRRKSPNFGKHLVVELSDENKRMIWVPPGFAHGFRVISQSADVLYKVTDYYAPLHERVLKWNDPALAIDWRLKMDESPVLAERDMKGSSLASAEVFEGVLE
jgi:dTDP-4-dehydrorhamnose 3,5-epimerase